MTNGLLGAALGISTCITTLSHNKTKLHVKNDYIWLIPGDVKTSTYTCMYICAAMAKTERYQNGQSTFSTQMKLYQSGQLLVPFVLLQHVHIRVYAVFNTDKTYHSCCGYHSCCRYHSCCGYHSCWSTLPPVLGSWTTFFLPLDWLHQHVRYNRTLI